MRLLVNPLVNPMILRMVLLLVAAIAAFGLGLFLIRRLRKNLSQESEALNHAPLAAEGLPVHAYHAVIQLLKQQKHELTSRQLSERRKAKASDSLSSTILSNLSCGVLFLNTSGLVRQANAAARKLLGFASPVGLHAADLFRTATLRPENNCPVDTGISKRPSSKLWLPLWRGRRRSRAGAQLLHTGWREPRTRSGCFSGSGRRRESHGHTLVLTDKTDIERIRHDQKVNQEISSELALGLRDSLTTIAGYAHSWRAAGTRK